MDRVMQAYAQAGYDVDYRQRLLPDFFCGLDLGQVNDPTAMGILRVAHTQYGRVIEIPDRGLDLVHLEKFELQTPYPSIVTSVMKRMVRLIDLGRGVTLLVDGTGVGRAVIDLFSKAVERVEDINLVAITFTAGTEVTEGDAEPPATALNVPVRDMVGAAQVALQTRRLRWPKGMQYTKELVKELKTFKVKIVLSKLGVPHDSYEAWREGDHDDIVFAVSMACWGASQESLGGARPEFGPDPLNWARQ